MVITLMCDYFQMLSSGKLWTKRSRHLPLTRLAMLLQALSCYTHFLFYVSYLFSHSVPLSGPSSTPNTLTLILSSPILSSTSFSSPVEFYLFSDFLVELPFSTMYCPLFICPLICRKQKCLIIWVEIWFILKRKHCFRYIKNNFQLVAKGTDEVCMHVHIRFPCGQRLLKNTGTHRSALVQTVIESQIYVVSGEEESAK